MENSNCRRVSVRRLAPFAPSASYASQVRVDTSTTADLKSILSTGRHVYQNSPVLVILLHSGLARYHSAHSPPRDTHPAPALVAAASSRNPNQQPQLKNDTTRPDQVSHQKTYACCGSVLTTMSKPPPAICPLCKYKQSV